LCFSLLWFESLLVWIIVVCAVVALLRLLIGFVLPKLGIGGEILGFVVKAITIVMWAVICIALVYFIFDLIMCLGPSMPHLGAPGRP
jgi:hypothetical protein